MSDRPRGPRRNQRQDTPANRDGRPAHQDRHRTGSPSAPRKGNTTRGNRPAAATSWDPLAEWYVGWVGEDGSKHHRLLAIPAVMEALALKPRETLLDIGCGHGVLASYVTDVGARYFGMDASPKLIEHAKETHGNAGRFIVGDARRIPQQREFRPGQFDAATFLLSIQDMDPIEPVLAGAAWSVRDGGRIVLLLTHPCFRIPRQSGWGWDEGRKLRFRRVDRYLTPLPVPLKQYGGDKGGVTRSFHRPLEDYINGLASVGLMVDYLSEIPTYKIEPTGPQQNAINMANREIPLFLAIRARKVGNRS